MRYDSRGKAAGWSWSFAPAEPGRSDALLASGALLAWALASVSALTPETRPAFVLAAFTTAVFVLALYRRDRLRAVHVLLLGLAMRLLVVGLPPLLSDDAYRYVWDGLVQLRGLNPYAAPPEALAGMVGAPEVLEAMNSPAFYSVYPPVSQLVFLLAGLAYEGAGFGGAYALLKSVFVAADVGVLVLLLRCLPARRALLWAAAPLVVIEGAGQVHTEALCALALVGAVWMERRGRGAVMGGLVAAAGWVKLVPWLVLPVWVLRRAWATVATAGILGILLALPYAAPFVPTHVRASLDLYVRLFEFNAGPYLLLKQTGFWITGADESKTLGPALRLVFLGALPALWVVAARQRWPLARTGLWVYGLFLVAATTLHPWYLTPVLALLLLTGRAGWAWQSLGMWSVGTYWFYTGGPYWPFVWIGWGSWAMLLAAEHRAAALKAVMHRRATGKVRRLQTALPPLDGLRVLDLGAGEGYVGAALARAGASVTLSDVADSVRVGLPGVWAPGRLPFASGAFDVVVLVYVLHHAVDAEGVLREALRVGRRVVVLESVFERPVERRLLEALDRTANRLRGGWMRPQEAHLRFRTATAWEALLGDLARPVASTPFGRPPHRQWLGVFMPLLQPQKVLAEKR